MELHSDSSIRYYGTYFTYVSCQVLTAASMNMTVFCDIAPYSFVQVDRRLRGAPDVVLEWLTLLLRFWEVLSSNLGPETGYPDCFFFHGFSSPSRCRDNTLKLGHDRFLPNPFQFIIQLSPYNSRYTVLVTEKAS
jgi:hypothetical protein